MTIDLSRLRAPLNELWPDIRIAGIPVHGDAGSGLLLSQTLWATDISGDPTWRVYGVDDSLCLDLSQPAASDILARRVSMAAGKRVHNLRDPQWSLQDRGVNFDGSPSGQDWHFYAGGHFHDAAVLADVDPTDDTRLDWGNLGGPRVVDLEALLLVAQYLSAQETDQ